jgi:sigma-E factor negative regulatory protein RseC
VTVAREGSTIKAVVRALHGSEAEVEIEAGGCGRCHEKGGCGGQQLTQMFCSSPRTYRVDNAFGAIIGDRVTVAIAAGSVRRTANLAYGVPLASGIVGALLGTPLGGDLGAIVGAAVGLVLALFYVRSRSQESAGNFKERPYIISRS